MHRKLHKDDEDQTDRENRNLWMNKNDLKPEMEHLACNSHNKISRPIKATTA